MKSRMKDKIYKYRYAKDKIVINVLKTVESFNMIEDGDKILISISGGPDSTFLTHLLYLIRPVFNLTLYGFCLDHMTRSGESARDALFAATASVVNDVVYLTCFNTNMSLI